MGEVARWEIRGAGFVINLLKDGCCVRVSHVRKRREKRDEASTYALDALINNTRAAPEVTNYKINSGGVA